MNICIIQARMSSSRLPGKVLLEIAGRPMLEWVVERARLAKTVDRVIVATTTDPADGPIAAFCEAQGYPFTRGSQHDVLDRYVQAARQFKADVVVRVTADCPLLDPGLLDETVGLLMSRKLDFAANRLPPPWGRNFPIGLDVEVATMGALERAWRETSQAHFREHVMPYFYDDLPLEPLATGDSEINSTQTDCTSHVKCLTPRGFHIALLLHAPDHGSVRWTVDTPEDLAAVRRLAALLPKTFTWLDALKIWESRPEIAALNAGVAHKTSRDVEERK